MLKPYEILFLIILSLLIVGFRCEVTVSHAHDIHLKDFKAPGPVTSREWVKSALKVCYETECYIVYKDSWEAIIVPKSLHIKKISK
jgi:hypothetical protein